MDRSSARTFCLIVLSILSVAIVSCSKKMPGPMQDRAYSKQLMSAEAAAFSPQRGDRLLVKTASMTLSVPALPAATESVLRIVRESEGYVQDTMVEKDSFARLHLRVPAERLVPVLDDLARLGTEKNRHISSEDVTEQVADMEAELTNKRMLRDRLRALLDRAKDVKDVLAVETELNRLQTEIDFIEGRLKRMRGDIQYSVINLELRPAPREQILGPLGYLYVGAKWVITKLFVIQPGE